MQTQSNVVRRRAALTLDRHVAHPWKPLPSPRRIATLKPGELVLLTSSAAAAGGDPRLTEPATHDDDLCAIAYQPKDAAGLHRGSLTP
ncbi:hypothetical protein [Streptomyces sp. NPDC020362]|uniref:hypothetical protein n=1 Tax=unclassified Streptomyces TaxID=2593676 RepID=UPI000B115E79